MTRRKPAGVSFESWIDAQIREACERGEFDDLPGAGRPLENLGDADDPLWWAKRLVRRERLSLLPPALEVRLRAQRFRERLAELPSEAAVRTALEDLNAAIAKVNRTTTGGVSTSQPQLDVEALVARWREARAERSVRGA
jgi:hypothetical protein